MSQERDELVRELERVQEAWRQNPTMNNSVARAIAQRCLIDHDRKNGT